MAAADVEIAHTGADRGFVEKLRDRAGGDLDVWFASLLGDTRRRRARPEIHRSSKDYARYHMGIGKRIADIKRGKASEARREAMRRQPKNFRKPECRRSYFFEEILHHVVKYRE